MTAEQKVRQALRFQPPPSFDGAATRVSTSPDGDPLWGFNLPRLSTGLRPDYLRQRASVIVVSTSPVFRRGCDHLTASADRGGAHHVSTSPVFRRGCDTTSLKPGRTTSLFQPPPSFDGAATRWSTCTAGSRSTCFNLPRLSTGLRPLPGCAARRALRRFNLPRLSTGLRPPKPSVRFARKVLFQPPPSFDGAATRGGRRGSRRPSARFNLPRLSTGLRPASASTIISRLPSFQPPPSFDGAATATSPRLSRPH